MQALRDQERRQQRLRTELASRDRPRVVPLSVGHLKELPRAKAEECQALLRKHARIARQMVRKLVEGRIVEGRIVFTPDRGGAPLHVPGDGHARELLQRATRVSVPNGVVPEWAREVLGEVKAA